MTRRSDKNQQQIEWRQSQVLQYAAFGYSEREIATKLQISQPTIHRDLVILKRRAKEDIRKYIDEQVPFEYKKTLAGLEDIIKYASNIMSDESSENTKEKMQAASIRIQAYNMKMEMVSGANLIEEGIELVERYRGLTDQNGKVTKDGTQQPT